MRVGVTFIGFGALYFTLVPSDASLGFALTRVLGGLAFSLGLILVAVAGAELFTGNNFLVMAWAEGRIPISLLARNWAIVYVANAVGALGMVALVASKLRAQLDIALGRNGDAAGLAPVRGRVLRYHIILQPQRAVRDRHRC